ncbi:MAG: codV [Bacillales bacterium]|nr:codV [Bacillales bacterium]
MRRSDSLSFEELQIVNEKRRDISFNTAVSLFISDCEIRNLRHYTIVYYKTELRQFERLLTEQGINTMPKLITKANIRDNIILYLKSKGTKVVTINTKLRAIKAFFYFLRREKIVRKNIFEDIKMLNDRKKIGDTFSNEELEKLFRQPDLKTFTGWRDLTFMMLLLETCVRLSEIAGICISDIHWSDSKIRIRNTKNHFERYVPIQKKMGDMIQKYLKIRGEVDSDFLFISIDGNPLSRVQYQKRIAKYTEMIGIKGSPHKFRRTGAKLSVKNGANIFELQQILGHQSLDMVRVYVNLYSNEVIEKHKKFSPINCLNITV